MDRPSNPAWIALLVSGILNLLWALAYFVWSLVPLAFGGVSVIVGSMQALDGGDPATLISGMLTVLSPIISIVAYLIAVPLAAITILAAFRLKSWRSKGIVWLGAISAVLAPGLGVVASLSSFCSCACVGFVLGNIGTFPVLLIGLGTAIWTAVVLFSDTARVAFTENG